MPTILYQIIVYILLLLCRRCNDTCFHIFAYSASTTLELDARNVLVSVDTCAGCVRSALFVANFPCPTFMVTFSWARDPDSPGSSVLGARASFHAQQGPRAQHQGDTAVRTHHSPWSLRSSRSKAVEVGATV